jgi:hypothetical protein
MFALTWKRRLTQSGRRILALRASALRTDGSDCSSWQTPKCPSGGGQETRETAGGGLRKLEDQVLLSAWATPTQNDAKGSGYMYDRGDHSKIRLKLPGEAVLAHWPTPMAGSPATEMYNEAGNTDSSRKTVALLGPISSGSLAETAKPGQLNPAFSLWLMGYPTEWARCAGQVTRSSRKSRPSS